MAALKRTHIFMEQEHLDALEKISKGKGLKTAQLIRLAVAEYIEKQKSEQRREESK